MHILIVSQYFWPESFRINDLAVGLQEKGHQVTVLTGLPNYPKGTLFPGYSIFNKHNESYNGINVIRVPLIPRGNSSKHRLVLNYLSFVFFACCLSPFMCVDKYDAIYVFAPSPITVALPAILLKKIMRIPLLLSIQDLWPESLTATGAVNSGKILKVVDKLVKYIYNNSDKLLMQSPSFVQLVERFDIPPNKIEYYPNSIEKFFQPISESSIHVDIKPLPNGFIVMFAGNIGEAQDFPTILAAAKKLREYKDIHWVILGDGRAKSWVEAQVHAEELNETVHLYGRFPVDAMPHYFAYADVMLVTLKRDPVFALTLPTKIQSYFACAKPIIAALDGEGAKVINDSGAGLVSPAEDVNQLSDSVLRMYNMAREERNIMGNNGKTYCDTHFDRELLLNKLDAWFHDVTMTTGNSE
jgi:glycosyltransferase involved in cell wall biosynthesis